MSKHYDVSGQQTSTTPVGISKGYAPLEQYNQNLNRFSPQTDIYSLGATLYKLVTGETPPEATIINEDGLPAKPQSVSPNVWDAITAAMQPRRKDRPSSVAEFLAILTPTTSSYDATRLASEPELDVTVVTPEPKCDSDLDSERDGDDEEKKSLVKIIVISVVCVVVLIVLWLSIFGGQGSSSKAIDYVDTTELVDSIIAPADSAEALMVPASESDEDVIVEELTTTPIPQMNVESEPKSEIQEQECKASPQSKTRGDADLSASGKASESQNSASIYNAVDQNPEFPGGLSALSSWLSTHISYPASAAEAGISGRVVVQFVVEKDGHISSASVVRGKDPALDAEAIRVVSSMPRWTPGRLNGSPVRVRYNLPINFKLPQ
jgi:protein TonB